MLVLGENTITCNILSREKTLRIFTNINIVMMTQVECWFNCKNIIDNIVNLQGQCIPLCGQIHCSCLSNCIFACMHVVAEAGLLAQRALFISHRRLGPSVAIGAIDLPADDVFFSVSVMVNNPNVTN